MISATVTWLFEGSPPCSWESLLGDGSISLKHLIPLPSHWSVIIGAVIISVWVFNLHLHVLLGMWPSSHPAGVWIWSARFMPWGSVGQLRMWPTAISGSIFWRAEMFWWLAMWPVWCVTARPVTVSSVGWARLSWTTPVVAASIPVLWSRVALHPNHDDSICDVFDSGTVIWIGFAYLYLHGGASNMIWHGDFCVICDV